MTTINEKLIDAYAELLKENIGSSERGAQQFILDAVNVALTNMTDALVKLTASKKASGKANNFFKSDISRLESKTNKLRAELIKLSDNIVEVMTVN